MRRWVPERLLRASSKATCNSAVTIGSLGAPAGCITARPVLFVRLDKETLLFAVVELHDAGIRAAGLPVSAPIDPRKTGLVEVFLHEIVREERTSVPVPDQMDDELGPQAHGFLVRDREVGTIPSEVGLDRPVQVGEAQSEHPIRFQNPPKLRQDGN